jgi:hypothetical protein
MLAEVVGVGVTFCTGLVIGFICCAWTNPSNAYDWPTPEMQSRGEVCVGGGPGNELSYPVEIMRNCGGGAGLAGT